MSDLKTINITLEKYKKLVDNGEIDETTLYMIDEKKLQKKTNLTEQYRELEQDFFAYQKMLNEANKDLNKYYLENTKLKELLKTHRLLFELEKDNTKNVLQRGKYAYLIKDIDQVLGEE